MAHGIDLQGQGLLVRDVQDGRILHPQDLNLYQYHLGIRFEPGAAAEVFQPRFELPIISFRGRGRVAGAMRIFQHPQLWFNQQRGINGVGGIQTGQILGQPLLDPSAPVENSE